MPILGPFRLENLYVHTVTALSVASLALSFFFRWHKILARRDRADATRSRYLWVRRRADGRETRCITGRVQRGFAETEVGKCLGKLEKLGGDLSVVSLGIDL